MIMLNHITPIPDLLKEATEIQAFLDITCSEEIAEIIDRGNRLSAIISRTVKMRADSEYHRDALMQSEIMRLVAQMSKAGTLPASTVNKLIHSACKDANYLVTITDRLNRTATHQLDFVRSLISYEKEQLRLKETGY